MGAYLSEPVKEKVSEDGGDPRFSYGASSMQGWRISQEDAHNCIISLGDDAKLSLFAVYDGHGGAEVAQYTAQHFPQHIFKQKQSSSKTNFSDTLEESFLSFDQHLKQPAVLQNLREIAGGGGKPANKDADPKEARMLQKEASMPLEQILAKYVHHRASAMLKERRRADGEEVSDEDDEGDEDEEEDDDDEDEEGEEDEDDDDDDDDAQDEEENEDEGGEKVVNGKKEDDAEQEKTPKENGVMVNGDHASSEEAAAEAEAEEEKSSTTTTKDSKFEMEEFGIKGASKCGKGGKGKGKKTLLPRVPIEASPAIQAKTDSKAPKTESKLAKVDPAPIPLKMDLEQQLLNGHSENENNENKEREQQTRTNGDNSTPPRAEENDQPAVETPPDGTASSLKTEDDDGVQQQQQQQQHKSESDSKEKTTTTTTTAGEAATNGDVEKKSSVVENGSAADAEAAATAAAAGEKKVDAVVEEEGANAEGANAEGSSAGSSSAGATSAGSKRSRKAAPVRHVKLLEMNTDDDSDDSEDDLETKMMKDLQEPESDDSEGDDDGDDDDGGEEDDDEDGEDDEDEEADGDDDDDDDEDYEDIQGGGEEPGFDSGCTACVSLLVGNELFVANVGDSRCVVSRAGEAVDMSFDHKPTDEVETDRITKAGGKVTEDGRVNGGLNLSRALGDHSYKKVTNLSDREQMISALPDIKSMVLTTQDEFMVIACDGIWNSLTSQEVIDFVKMRIDHEKELTLSQICEELFDHCLAPHTMGDGTGCDNMTCIIVRFDSVPAMSGSGKRSKAEDGEAAEAPSGKRQRLDGDEKVAA